MVAVQLELDDIAAFVHIVDEGGISAAARALHAPKSSVSRRLARLERHLGTRLLHRTTRSVTPTEAGRQFYARASAALSDLRSAAGAVFDAREVPRGTVRLAAQPDIGVEVLPELVAAFVAEHPEVRVEIELALPPSGPGSAAVDLRLQVGKPIEHGVAAIRLQNMGFHVYAAPAYLARAGVPTTAEDLTRHDCVLLNATDGRARWVLHHRDGPHGGPALDVVVRGPVATVALGFARRAAAAGAGLVLLPRLVGENAVRDGSLVPVLPEYQTETVPLYLVHPAAPHVPLAVRALRDHLVRTFPQ